MTGVGVGVGVGVGNQTLLRLVIIMECMAGFKSRRSIEILHLQKATEPPSHGKAPRNRRPTNRYAHKRIVGRRLAKRRLLRSDYSTFLKRPHLD